MTLWARLLERGRRLFEMESAVEKLPDGEACAPDPNDVGFTAAVIGLGAKLAKADGTVTDDEVAVFSKVFRAAPEDEESVRRVFNLARQTVSGYQGYARRIGRRYRNRPCLLEGVLDGLFYIAGADGVVTRDELEFLENVAEAFGFDEATYRRIKASHLGADPSDPYAILGVTHDAEFTDIKSAYRRLMVDNHPDKAVANGAPIELQKAAHEKAAAITSAYAKIRAERGMLVQAD